MSDQEALSSTNCSSDEYCTIEEDSSKSETESISTFSDAKEENDQSQYSLTLAIKDIEDKLSDVLIENVKLKNILKQKDDAIRKQFNTIVILEREIMQICENYKIKFVEIKNLVAQSKQDNKNLYAMISSSDVQNSSINCDSSDEGCNVTLRNGLIIRSEVTTNDELVGCKADSTEDLMQKIKKMATSRAQLQSKLNEVEKQRKADLDQFNKQLENRQNELELLKHQLVLPEKSKLLKLINEDYKKKLERKYLIEIIKLLEQKLQISQINCGTQIERNVPESDSQDEKCREFIECFIKQCVQNTDLKQFETDCKRVVQTFKNLQLSCDDIFIENVTNKKNDAICDYRNILIEEQLQRIKDERITLMVQRQFLKVLADYNKVVTQLEMLKYENSRLSELNETDSSAQNFAVIEKCLFEEKKIFDAEIKKMSEKRLSIEQEKQSIREEWELLSVERTVLLVEKDELIEESRRLKHEYSLLEQKTAAFNNKNAKQTRDVALEEKLRQTTDELEGVKVELQNTHETIAELQEELSKLNNQESEVTAYKLQAEMQEAEFLVMREAERNYLQQIENLSTEIYQLREENRQLAERNQNENN
ncbi:ecotropic viral integration site 5 ortholog isoform X3 [Nasonia vitripennis]|uniref:Uncharacterized protein n=1 Tax=Nasonia vitripennis TaxID=7425 RepID=A0A7M7QAD2_NASVI|nr:ecotropic viral integration site 5 ortholog isoform X3 [Nasonia vitripennis]XP_031782451.1 ecotropic viral integration site 5 ortholog isoform X3 [Nasonia vitripennis]XP_031782452.1 ecotropic viral integration site 5 ortholog isoform X3 [Nasonia vitripennis]XP_031782453.1 ecotropic viral integration site 5 ortholog isoform X3 [Nasonia vitripennis]